MEQFAKLIAHLAWADDRVLASLRSATAPDAACLELFAHVLAAEHVWLARLQGETPRHVVWPPHAAARRDAAPRGLAAPHPGTVRRPGPVEST